MIPIKTFLQSCYRCKENMNIQGADKLCKNKVTHGEANSTGMQPEQKSKQSWATNLALHKHCFIAQVLFIYRKW
jgi:hypothetical protein